MDMEVAQGGLQRALAMAAGESLPTLSAADQVRHTNNNYNNFKSQTVYIQRIHEHTHTQGTDPRVALGA